MGKRTRGATASAWWRVAVLVAAWPLVGPSLVPRLASDGASGSELARHPDGAGAALRAALEARARGAYAEADRRLAEVSEAYPLVTDHADLLRARTQLEGGSPVEAVALGEGALATHRDSPLRSMFLDVLASAYLTLGAEAAARDVIRLALEAESDPERRAGLLAALGASLERGGHPAEAAEAYRELWRRHPEQPAAAQAAARLDALERRVGAELRTTRDHLERADRLFGQHRNEEALAGYQVVLGRELRARDRRHALAQRARCLFRLRRYPEAARAFATLGDRPGEQIEHARALARGGQVKAAVRELESLAQRLHGPPAERARYLAALLLDEPPSQQRARRHFERLARSARDPGIRRDSRWRLAWAAYREGGFETAMRHLVHLESTASDGIEALQARYWKARSLEQRGDARAQSEFAAIAAEYPLTYYGWRAATRQGGEEADPPAPRGPTPGDRTLRPRDLERLRILMEAGLMEEARRELAGLARGSLSLVDRLDLAELALDAGDANRAERLVVDAYNEDLARGPVAGLEELWWMAWPWVYPGAVERVDSRVPTELVYAVMREESGYRPEVVSVVGARGLLQIMPETGSRLARDLGLPAFRADDLFDPQLNLRLGIHYLAKLDERFPGRPSAAIGSYNAGPSAVARWLEEGGALDDDEWVETIPYSQTRAYVKRVLRSLHAYEVLY